MQAATKGMLNNMHLCIINLNFQFVSCLFTLTRTFKNDELLGNYDKGKVKTKVG